MEERVTINEVINIIPCITTIPYRKIWIDYDEKVDVLYINFTTPPRMPRAEARG